jgi:hypothetical protein
MSRSNHLLLAFALQFQGCAIIHTAKVAKLCLYNRHRRRVGLQGGHGFTQR